MAKCPGRIRALFFFSHEQLNKIAKAEAERGAERGGEANSRVIRTIKLKLNKR